MPCDVFAVLAMQARQRRVNGSDKNVKMVVATRSAPAPKGQIAYRVPRDAPKRGRRWDHQLQK